MVMSFDLREVQRQVVSQEPMLHTSLFHRDLCVRQRQLLEIVGVVHERIMVALGDARPAFLWWGPAS